jgi:hypothetical protein
MQAKRYGRRLTALAVGFAALAIPGSASGATTTFTNPTPITINDSNSEPTKATPYPATISASGLDGPVSDVDVTLKSVSHGCPPDIDTLLVGPSGEKTIVLADSGTTTCPSAGNVTVTFDDEAPSAYPCAAGSPPAGTFRPTNNNTPPCGDADSFPDAPSGPYPLSLSVFDGTNPNGTWSLYVVDDLFLASGTIAEGWSLTIATPDPPQATGGDTDPPNTTITKGPKDKTKKKTATFEFTGTDARAISGFQCKLDARPFVACTSPYTVRVKRGKHTFQVQAIDQAGNVDGSPATDSWKRKKKRKK